MRGRCEGAGVVEMARSRVGSGRSGCNQCRALKPWYVQRGTLSRESQGDAVCETEDAGTEEGVWRQRKQRRGLQIRRCLEHRRSQQEVTVKAPARAGPGGGGAPGGCRGRVCNLANGTVTRAEKAKKVKQ